MFGFLGMMGDYEQRKVGRYDNEAGDVMVSTASVTDSAMPYETAVCHPRFNSGKIIVVEMYGSKDEAVSGHERWVSVMTAEELPASLRDVSTAEIADVCDVVSGSEWREKQRA